MGTVFDAGLGLGEHKGTEQQIGGVGQAAVLRALQKSAIGRLAGGDVGGCRIGQGFQRLQFVEAGGFVEADQHLTALEIALQLLEPELVVLGQLLAGAFIVARERLEGGGRDAGLQRLEIGQAEQGVAAL